MAKKWKAYPWPDRANSDDSQEEDDEPQQQPTVTSIPTKTIVSNSNSKAFKQQQQQQQNNNSQEDDEEIDVVGVGTSVIIANTTATSTGKQEVGKSKLPTTSTCWGPSSPTEGTTAPSPPPHLPEAATRDSTTLYNGKSQPFFFFLPKWFAINFIGW